MNFHTGKTNVKLVLTSVRLDLITEKTFELNLIILRQVRRTG